MTRLLNDIQTLLCINQIEIPFNCRSKHYTAKWFIPTDFTLADSERQLLRGGDCNGERLGFSSLIMPNEVRWNLRRVKPIR